MRRKFYTVLRAGAKALTIVPEGARMVALRAEGARPPFYMVDSYPHFIDVVKLLGADQPVFSLIGHEEMLAAGIYNIEDEAARHVETILGYQPSGPYMLGGCSASGIVAYETMRQLVALGHEVSLLVLFDIQNPYYMREYSKFWLSLSRCREDWQKLHAYQIPQWAALKFKLLFTKESAEINGSFSLNGGADHIGPSDLRIDVARKYHPVPYEGDVLLFKRTGPFTGRYRDPSFGWGETARGGLQVYVVNATEHLEIFKSPIERSAIARALREKFDQIAMAASPNQACGVLRNDRVG